MELMYAGMPTLHQFQKDSSITFAVRKQDMILTRIDDALAAYNKADREDNYQARRLMLVELFFTCNFWVKGLNEGREPMRKERYPAVIALFEVVVRTLGLLLGKSNKAALARAVTEMFGRAASEHAVRIDEGREKAVYFSNLAREIYRIRFKGGLAYQYQWWMDMAPTQLVPAQSEYAYNKHVGRAGAKSFENWGAFVMTLERALYMAYHYNPDFDDKCQKGVFHTVYTAGEPVLMAGTMKIDNGIIRGIRSDSGHYLPQSANMVGCLQALAMYAVNLNEIEVFEWGGESLGSAQAFLRTGMSWDKFVEHQKEHRQHMALADQKRQEWGVGKRFRHLPPPLPKRPQGV